MSRKPIHLPKEQIEDAIRKTNSMAGAAKLLGVTNTSFVRYAKQHGLYQPNPGLKGVKRGAQKPKYSIDELLESKTIGSAKLKVRLLAEGLLCPNCHTQTPTYCRGQTQTNLKWLRR
jgi:hypothetical protein